MILSCQDCWIVISIKFSLSSIGRYCLTSTGTSFILMVEQSFPFAFMPSFDKVTIVLLTPLFNLMIYYTKNFLSSQGFFWIYFDNSKNSEEEKQKIQEEILKLEVSIERRKKLLSNEKIFDKTIR